VIVTVCDWRHRADVNCESGGGCRTVEDGSLVVVSALHLLQFCDTVGSVTGRESGSLETCATYPKDFLAEIEQEDQEVDQRGHGKRLCKKIARHII